MEVELKIPYINAGMLSRLHDQGRILAEHMKVMASA